MRRIRHVLAAPASFKETLGAAAVAAAMARGARAADPACEVDCCPIADGGEGSLDALAAALGASIEVRRVVGPLGEPVDARLGLARREADPRGLGIVELAQASGLGLVPPARRDPEAATTCGTGELLAAAAASGCREILVCLGGSATVDGGAGLAQAAGAVFRDRRGRAIREPLTGGRLEQVASVEPARGLPEIRALCDVRNPLLGPGGAAAVYGPQKGATPAQVERLEAALRHLAELPGIDPRLADIPGAGAAGGAGFGLAAFCGAHLERGIDAILGAVRFDDRCRRADLVLTGEGSLDAQTLQGKACAGVLAVAQRHGVPVFAIVGRVGAGAEALGFAKVVSLQAQFGLDCAMADTARAIEEAVKMCLA